MNSTIKEEKLFVGVIHRLIMGGAERMMVNILNYFAEDGKEVHLVIFNHMGALIDLLDSRIVIHDLEMLSVAKGMPKCLKKLKNLKPDIIFSGTAHVNIALAPFIPIMKIFLPQTRWIARETNLASMKNKKQKYPKLFDFLYRNVYKNYTTIIAQSEDMRDDLLLNYPSAGKKSLVINNPIDIDRVTELSKEEITYSFNSKKINLINVAIMRQAKRHNLLLEVFSKLPSNYNLVLVGSGDEEDSLKLLAKSLNIEERVTFEGHRSNPYPYIESSDLFVLSSEHEGFPNVLLEANSLGLPIVAFACPGGITEIIEEGKNGFSVSNGDIEEMVKTIIKASDYQSDREKIIARTRERFAHNIILEQYREVFYV